MKPKHRAAGAPTRAFLAASATPCKHGSFRLSLKATALASPGRACSGGETELRIHPLVSAFAASLIALMPAHAFAQAQTQALQESVSVRDRDRPEYEPQGARVGTFVLDAGVDIELAHTDNLFAAGSGNEFDDMIYTASPMVHAQSDWSRNMLAIEVGASFRGHEDFDNENSDTHYLRSNGRIDIGDATNLYGAVRFANQVTPRTDPDSPTVGSPVEYDRVDYSAGVEHRFARFSVRGDVGSNDYDYRGTQAFRDNQETYLRGRVEAEVSPRFNVLVQVESDKRDYENSPQFDSEGQKYLVGVAVNSDLMRGDLSVGQFEREYDSGDTFDGLAIAGELEWYITELTTVTFNARRDADDQIGANSGLPYITQELSVRADHELLRNVIVTGALSFGEQDFDTVDRTDEFSEVEIGADYLLNRRVVLHARYERDEVESSGALAYRDYELNVVSLGVSLRL